MIVAISHEGVSVWNSVEEMPFTLLAHCEVVVDPDSGVIYKHRYIDSNICKADRPRFYGPDGDDYV